MTSPLASDTATLDDYVAATDVVQSFVAATDVLTLLMMLCHCGLAALLLHALRQLG